MDKHIDKYIAYLINWLQQTAHSANVKGFVIGISGGLDSAVVGALIKQAFPTTSLGVIMPIGKMVDFADAKLVVEHLDLNHQVIDLTNVYDSLTKVTSVTSQSALINIKPRLRMTTLYALAQENNYLVVGTGNAVEWALGYFTKYGDGGVDLLPLIHLNKAQVKQMAQLLNIPQSIIDKAPSAGLFPGQTDEKEWGFSYAMVDQYLANQAIPADIKQKIVTQNQRTHHKRAPILSPQRPQKFFK